MIKDWVTKIKVDKKVKPIPYTKRTSVPLSVGRHYYVSFGSSVATPCIITAIEEYKNATIGITIEVPTKVKSKKGRIDVDGNISHRWFDTYRIFSDEIGLTPEQAVNNVVTF